VGALIVPNRLYAEIRRREMRYIDAVEFVRRRQGAAA
jgi:hypothetical protein